MTVFVDTPADIPGEADVLLIGVGTDARHRELIQWHDTTPYLHDFLPEFHRLSLEHWVWTFKDVLDGKSILDIGAQNPRRWFGPGYRTFGHTDDVQADIRGDLLKLSDSVLPVDAIICTEVLEHCTDPFEAVRQMRLALKPTGLLLVTSPFLWPWHGTEDYADYFRFTRQGWQLLLKDFYNVRITPVPWTSEAKVLLDLVRRFEGWGFKHLIEGHTAYLCSATK